MRLVKGGKGEDFLSRFVYELLVSSETFSISDFSFGLIGLIP